MKVSNRALFVLFFSISFCFQNCSNNEQKHQDIYEKIDSLVFSQTTEQKKIETIYDWIINNITYNDTLLKSQKKYNVTKEIVEHALTYKNGTCQHFADLFTHLSHRYGIKTYTILGFTKGRDNQFARVTHTWNLTILENQYLLSDPTWDHAIVKSGQNSRKNYFLIDPKRFIKTHYPFDPIWQCLDTFYSFEQFRNHAKNSKSVSIDFKTEQINFFNQTAIKQLESSLQRLTDSNFHLIVKQRKEYKASINKESLILASEYINKAIDILNDRDTDSINFLLKKVEKLINRDFKLPIFKSHKIAIESKIEEIKEKLKDES